MRRIVPAEYRQMPWRNGGGTTTEIFVAPAEGRFVQRVSIASVASDGPFSRYDGYDRHMMLLAGEGVTLDCGVHGTIDLRTPLEPRTFSGDWDVHGALVDGAVRDFNLIVDRALASSSLEVRVLAGPETLARAPGTTYLVYVIDVTVRGWTPCAGWPDLVKSSDGTTSCRLVGGAARGARAGRRRRGDRAAPRREGRDADLVALAAA